MRIVAGRFRRRKLESNPGQTTRPITDRAKEILFEYLLEEIEGARVADVFAGTGTIGLEALSRGATGAVFIEQDHKAFELLQRNIEKLGAQDETLCWRVDVLRCSFRPKGVEQLLPYDLIFFDPPYRMVPDVQPRSPLYRSLERLARPGIAAENALLLFRTPLKSQFTMPPEWKPDRTLTLSNMEVHWYRRAEATDIPPPVNTVEADAADHPEQTPDG